MAQKKQKESYGILSEIYNQQTGPLILDWGIESYKNANDRFAAIVSSSQYIPPHDNPLPEGGLLTVFNTVAKGEELWQGTIALEFDRNKEPLLFNPNVERQAALGMVVHGFQNNVDPEEWAAMFLIGYPARLEKQGKTIFGSLEPYAETGTEGIIWAVNEYGQTGYDGLHLLENGDELAVYKNVTDGDIVWQGAVSFDGNQNSFAVHNGAMTVDTDRTPKHMEPSKWQQMYWDKNPVKFEP